MNGRRNELMRDSNREPDLDVDGWWWAMVILGVAIIILFGFYFCIDPNGRLVPHTDACTDHWRSWEMGAVLWAILFGVYYFLRFPELPDVRGTKTICALIFLAKSRRWFLDGTLTTLRRPFFKKLAASYCRSASSLPYACSTNRKPFVF